MYSQGGKSIRKEIGNNVVGEKPLREGNIKDEDLKDKMN